MLVIIFTIIRKALNQDVPTVGRGNKSKMIKWIPVFAGMTIKPKCLCGFLESTALGVYERQEVGNTCHR
jgi:hypothetical protein